MDEPFATVEHGIDANVEAFRKWFTSNGGIFHSAVRFVEVSSGFSILALDTVSAESTIVSCPFSLAVTKSAAQKALSTLLGSTSHLLDTWSPRQCIASYLSFHRIVDESSSAPIFKHYAYVKILPDVEKLRTGLHLSPIELQLFKGSNLYGAIGAREEDWRREWGQCHAAFAAINPSWGDLFTWELYLAAASHLSSRAFPSQILSRTPTLEWTESAEPILLPGVDALNHKRNHPVSWVIIASENQLPNTDEELSVSIVSHSPTNAGHELFNNYGAKANAELILGYGFTLKDNPEDTILLKIAGVDASWQVGREARGMDGLWTEILRLISEEGAELSYEDLLEAGGLLADMTQSLMDRLPDVDPEVIIPDVREDVIRMLSDYIEGQRAILEAVYAFANQKTQLGLEMAKELGIDPMLEDSDDSLSV